MMQDAKAFWDAMRSHVARLCRQETANALRAERYDVTTAPDGKVIGVRQPFGAQEIKIPYAAEVASAAVGVTVLLGHLFADLRAAAFAGRGGHGAGGLVGVDEQREGVVLRLRTGIKG